MAYHEIKVTFVPLPESQKEVCQYCGKDAAFMATGTSGELGTHLFCCKEKKCKDDTITGITTFLEVFLTQS